MQEQRSSTWTRLWVGVVIHRGHSSEEKKKQDGKTRRKKKTEEGDCDTKTTVTIPYIKGVLEALSRVF